MRYSTDQAEDSTWGVWDVVNGITAHARTLVHTDQRVKLEVEAGKLMALVN